MIKMKILINGKELDFKIEQEKNVGEILGSIELECEKNGMTITGLKCDGEEIPAEKLDALFARDQASVGSIELVTISGKDVVSMVKELGVRFTQSIPLLQEIPVLLQTGKDLKVMETINSCSLDLHNLYQLIPLLSITELPTDPDINGIPLRDYPAELSPILKDLLGALEKKDTILVGDLSEYELAPRIEKLGAALSAI
jgi:hypothetical protein